MGKIPSIDDFQWRVSFLFQNTWAYNQRSGGLYENDPRQINT